jgi:AcrR family transcriptional regulator
MEATRDRIVEVATGAFMSTWYEDVTLRGVAAEAGVALQTVLNHFGTKEQLFAVALERVGDRIESTRWSVTPDDIDEAVATVVDDYERIGDSVLRFLALEQRVAVVRVPIERGRAGHERWVAHAFPTALADVDGAAYERRLAQLVVATDVYTWKLLRRDRELTRDQTITAMRELVLALHGNSEGGSA